MTTVYSGDPIGSVSVAFSRGPAPSWQSRALNLVLSLLPHKRRLASAASVRQRVRDLTVKPPSYEPVGLGRNVEAKLENKAGWPTYYIRLAAGSKITNTVVFLHGGAYIEEIARPHWRLLDYLTCEAPAECIVPIFPLAPHSKAQETVPAMGTFLGRLLQEVGPENVTLMGNSSGAGMALAAAQWIRDHDFPQPRQLLLLSPWADATLSQPEQAEIAARDPLLAIPGLIEAGRLYAGSLDVSHPYVSPLYGDFQELAPLTIFAGTRDLLFFDAVELSRKASRAGVRVDLRHRRDLPHNYPMFPTPEGREARAIMARMIGSELMPRSRPAVVSQSK